MSTVDRSPTCQLCAAERITPWYHEDDVCWIADCEICATPMVVWRRHGTEVPSADHAHMMDRLADVAGRVFDGHYVDDNMRNIPDHYHAHARPEGGFFGHGFRRDLSLGAASARETSVGDASPGTPTGGASSVDVTGGNASTGEAPTAGGATAGGGSGAAS